MKKITVIFLIFIILTFSFSNQVSGKIIKIEDVNFDYGVDDTDVNIYSPSILSSQLELDAGLYFEDAIDIPMSEGTGDFVRTGTKISKLDNIQDFIFFKYTLNDSGPVQIKISSSVSTDVYELFIDVFLQPEEWVASTNTYESSFPLIIDYGTPKAMTNYVSVGGQNFNTGIFNQGDKIDFTITVSQLKKGQVQKGASSKLFQSVTFEMMDSIFQFMGDKGYVDPDGTVRLSDKGYDASDSSYYQGIASSIYGIVRAGNARANAGKLNDVQRDKILADHIGYAINLLNDVNDTTGPNGLIQDDGSGSDPLYYRAGDLNIYLIDNLYMIMAIGEVIYEAVKGGPATIAVTDFKNLSGWMFKLVDSIANFQDGISGIYRETILKSNYATQGNVVQLESMALMAEVFTEVGVVVGNVIGNPNFDPGTTPTFSPNVSDIKTEIQNLFKVSSVSGYDLEPFGIFAESYDIGTSLKSNTSTLMGNILYAMHLISQFNINQASELTTNILRLFTADNKELLYQRVETSFIGYTDLSKLISTYENSYAIQMMQRLQIKWDAIDKDVSRAWGRKSITLLEGLVDLLYDDVDKAFFGEYDDESKTLVANPNFASTNRFVANAFISTILVKIFPTQLGVIVNDEVIVDDVVQIELEFSQIFLSDTFTFWDFIIPSSFQAKITIPEFNFEESATINTGDFFDFAGAGIGDSRFETVFYTPTKKGNYTINIELSSEGRVLLKQSFSLIALGVVTADIGSTDFTFSTDDSSFTAEFTLIDNDGIQIPNLTVNSSLGLSFENANYSNYVKTGRSDSSGKVSLKFDINQLEEDGLIKRDDNSEFAFLTLFVNVTNAKSFNLHQPTRDLRLEILVKLARINTNISPTNLQITQGTTESFTFSVSTLNQELSPISNAKVSYFIEGVIGSSNIITSDADGEATITFRDADLFGLSNLAIIEGGRTNTTIFLTIEHDDYPTKQIFKEITILPNSIKIIANPVQFMLKQKTIVENSKPSIDVEVATEDLFSRSVSAFVTLDWKDKANNEFYNIKEANGEKRIAPYTFSLDPSNLPAGEFFLEIIAEKEGLTSTFNSGLGGLGLDQVVVNNPKTVVKKITVEESSLQDIIISAIAVYGALFTSKLVGVGIDFAQKMVGLKVQCPHCGEDTNGKKAVCSNCGKNLKKDKPTSPENTLEVEKSGEITDTNPDENLAK